MHPADLTDLVNAPGRMHSAGWRVVLDGFAMSSADKLAYTALSHAILTGTTVG